MHSLNFSFAVALRSNAGHGLLNLEVSRSHTTALHIRQEFSGRVIGKSRRPLSENTEQSQETVMSPARFDFFFNAAATTEIYTLDRAAVGIGIH
jgi:hypothetical protein